MSWTPHRFTVLSKGSTKQRGKMNKTESAFAQILQARKLAGEIADWWFEAITLRITHPDDGQPMTYTPDFMVLMPDGETIFIDTKGGGPDNEGSIARAKAAAEVYPLWTFQIAKKLPKKDGGGWKVRTL